MVQGRGVVSGWVGGCYGGLVCKCWGFKWDFTVWSYDLCLYEYFHLSFLLTLKIAPQTGIRKFPLHCVCIGSNSIEMFLPTAKLCSRSRRSF